MVDTLRADHMSLYGYERPTTPFIDRFASEAMVFERARSQAACTFPSVNTLLTSRYAFDFYVQGENQMGIPAEYPTIAEILRCPGLPHDRRVGEPDCSLDTQQGKPERRFRRRLRCLRRKLSVARSGDGQRACADAPRKTSGNRSFCTSTTWTPTVTTHRR